MASIVDIILKVKDKASSPISNFNKELKKSGQLGRFVADKLSDLSFSGIAQSVKDFGKTLIENTKELSEEARVIKNLSEEAGFSAKTIQTMTFAAEKFGIDVDDATDFLRDFNFEVGDAAVRGTKGEQAFLNLGVSIRNASGILKDNDTLLREVSDALSKVEDTAQRAALAAQLFGEDNQKLLPILSSGADGLAQYTRELESMGAVIDDVAIAKLSEFDQTMKSISDSQKQLQIESIDTAKAAAKATEIWTIGINELSRAFVGLINVEDENLKRINDFADKHKRDVQPSIFKTAEAIEKERKELEKLVKTQLKESEALEKKARDKEKEARARKKNADAIANEIDELRAKAAVSDIERKQLREGIAQRKLETRAEELKEKGATPEQLQEFRELSTDEINRESSESLKQVKDSVQQVGEATDSFKSGAEKAADAADTARAQLEGVGEQLGRTTRRAGGLAEAFAGGDRASGLTNERLQFRASFQGMANNAASLNRQFDRARAASVAEILREVKGGRLELGVAEIRKLLDEFKGLTQRTGFEFGQVREFAELLGDQEREVKISFNPNQDFDNLSLDSQRQLAEQIVMAGVR